MKIVSFYADPDGGDYFKSHAMRLIGQCRALGVPCDIAEENFGSQWIDNERAKARFILRKFDELGEDFIWLDCDCEILRPIDFEIRADWGAYLRADKLPHDYVHYIKHAPKNRDFIECWIKTIEQQGRGSHTAFISLFDRLNSEIMPAGYFDLVLSGTPSKREYLSRPTA